MIELSEEYLKKTERKSSRGNQLKWMKDGLWYKADQNGYESLSEYVISVLLTKSSLQQDEYVSYWLDIAKYRHQQLHICVSQNFLKEGQSLITLERLFQSIYGVSLTETLYAIDGVKNKISFTVDRVEEMTGISGFGEYLSKMLIIDELFLNDDRHMHNIALIRQDDEFKLCPIFDNGAALLSDVRTDYPLNVPFIELREEVRSKPFSTDFREQSYACQELYGTPVQFSFSDEDIRNAVDEAVQYPEEIRERTKQILIFQKNRNPFYFL